MAIDMFLKIDGINGESMDSAHKNEIDIFNFGFTVSNSGSFSKGGSGKSTITDLTINKYVDATPDLFNACCTANTSIKSSPRFASRAAASPSYLLHE